MPRVVYFRFLVNNKQLIHTSSTCREEILTKLSTAVNMNIPHTAFGEDNIVDPEIVQWLASIHLYDTHEVSFNYAKYSEHTGYKYMWRHPSGRGVEIDAMDNERRLYITASVVHWGATAMALMKYLETTQDTFTISFHYPSLYRKFYEEVQLQLIEWAKTYFGVQVTVESSMSQFYQSVEKNLVVTGRDIVHPTMWLMLWNRLYGGKRKLVRSPSNLLRFKSDSDRPIMWYQPKDRENHEKWWNLFLEGNVRLLRDEEAFLANVLTPPTPEAMEDGLRAYTRAQQVYNTYKDEIRFI